MGASFGRGGLHPVEVETRGPPHDPGSDSEPEITETLAKHVIGPPAEHPSRRIAHQAPLIASFLI